MKRAPYVPITSSAPDFDDTHVSYAWSSYIKKKEEQANNAQADREDAQRFVEKFSRTLTPNRCVVCV
jgi:hypothetical protein